MKLVLEFVRPWKYGASFRIRSVRRIHMTVTHLSVAESGKVLGAPRVRFFKKETLLYLI